MLSFLNLWLFPFALQIRIAKLEALLYNKGKLIWFCCNMRATVDERGQRRCLFPSLHDLLFITRWPEQRIGDMFFCHERS